METVLNVLKGIFTNNKLSIACLFLFVLALFGQASGYDAFCRSEVTGKCWVEELLPGSTTPTQ